MKIAFWLLLFVTPQFVIATNVDSMAKEKVLAIRDPLLRNYPVLEIQQYKKQIKEAQRLEIDQYWIVNRLEYYLGQDYSKIGDFERAIEIGLSHLNFYQKKQDFENEIWAYNDLGIYYNNNRQYLKSIDQFQNAVAISKKNNYLDLLPDLCDGIAFNYVMLNRLEDARMYVEKTDQYLCNARFDIIDETKMYCSFTKASYFDKLGKYNEAEQFYKKAIILGSRLEKRKEYDARINLAKLFLTTRRAEEAKNILYPILQKLNALKDASVKEAYLMEAYFVLAQTFKNISQLDSALFYINKSEEQHAFFQSQYMFNQSKFFHNENRRNNLALGVDIGYELYQKTGDKKFLVKSLLFADKAKSNVLNERRAANQLLKNKEISQELKDLRSLWLFNLNEFKRLKNRSLAIATRNSIDSLDQALGLKNTNEFYVKDLNKFQKSLSSNDAVLEYFITNGNLYCFAIYNDKIECNKISFDKRDAVIAFYKLLQNPNSSIGDFKKIGSELYSYFFHKAITLKRDVSHLIIVPDDVLHYMVFDALPTQNANVNNWSKLNYLGNSYSVSYGFSLQTLGSNNAAINDYDYVGFAPSFEQNASVQSLQFGEEVLSLGSSKFGGKSFLASDATYTNLRNAGLKSSILQLYTHGVSSDSSYNASYIYLQDKKMYVDEIMSLPLQTDLCLLTACDVGLGKEFKGEGVTGVSWAFRAAGAQNVVQSLWKLNEQASAEILKWYYNHLANGETSIKALTFAKRSYLENAETSERLKHPYYWAGMNHYGTGTLVSAKRSTWYWWLFGVVGFGLLIFIYKKNRPQ